MRARRFAVGRSTDGNVYAALRFAGKLKLRVLLSPSDARRIGRSLIDAADRIEATR